MMPNNRGISLLLASTMAGTAAAVLSLPFDNAKTKLQAQKPDKDGKLPYKNIVDAL